MAKTVIIPIEFRSNSESLQRIEQQLGTVLNNSAKKFSQSQITDAKTLLANIKTTNEKLQKDLAKGELNTKQYENYLSLFKQITNQAKDLSGVIGKELTAKGLNILTKEELDRVNEATQKVEKLEKALDKAKAKQKEPKKFDDVLQGSGIQATDLKMGRFSNLENAKKKLEEMQAEMTRLNELENKTPDDSKKLAFYEEHKKQIAKATKLVTEQIAEEKKQADAVKIAAKEYETAQLNKEELLKQVMDTATKEQREVIEGLLAEVNAINKTSEALTMKDKLQKLAGDLNVFDGFVKGVKDNFASFVTGIATGTFAIQALRNTYRDTIKVVQELDKAFNDIAMVTTYTTKEIWNMKDAFVEIAKTTGLTVSEVTKLAGEFFRQGRSYSEVLKLTEAAGIAAKVAGISAGDSVNYLTSAINGYKLSADQAMAVSDKFAALAADSATDYEELAIALSKVAAQAYSAGVNMDNMMGFIAKALETTREAPENIGTAFKTIFARMQELKDFGKTLEDGVSVNRVATALESIGIPLTDTNNELRNLDEVLIDVGYKWASLSKNQKAYVATALAGTRQQTRLLAVFEDFDRTMELVDVSTNSLGATFAQQEKYYSSIAYAISRMQIAWQEFISNLTNSDAIIFVLDILTGIIEVASGTVDAFKDLGIVFTTITLSTMAFTLALAKNTQALYANAIAAAKAQEGGEALTDAQLNRIGMSKVTEFLEKAKDFDSLGKMMQEAFGRGLTAIKPLAVALKGFLTGPVGLTIIGITALTAAIVYLAGAEERAAKKNREFIESMRKSQAEMFNLRKEADSLEKLSNEYEQLSASASKTTEDLKRQAEIIQQLQDLAGEDFPVVSITGDVNIEGIKAKIQELRDEADKNFKDSMKETLDTYQTYAKAYSTVSDAAVKEQILIQKAIDDGRVASYSAFVEQEKKKQLQILATSKIQLDANKNLTTTKEGQAAGYDGEMVGTGTFYEVLDIDKVKTATDALNSMFEQNFENSSLAQQLQILDGLEFEDWGDGITAAVGEVSPELQNIISLMGMFNETTIDSFGKLMEGSVLSTEQLIKLNETLKLTIENETQRAELLKIMMVGGENTYSSILELAKEYNMTGYETLTMLQKVNETLDNLSFENLNNAATSLNSVFDELQKVNDMVNGTADYDLTYINGVLDRYPQIGEIIKNNGEISKQQIQEIAALEKEAYIADLNRKIDSLKTERDLNTAKIQLLGQLLTNEGALNRLAAQEELNGTLMSVDQMAGYYNTFFAERTANDINASKEAIKQNLIALNKVSPVEDFDNKIKAIDAMVATSSIKMINSFAGAAASGTGSIAERVSQEISNLLQANTVINGQIVNLQNVIAKVRNQGNLKGMKDTNDEAEKYAAKLNEIYIITQQLAFLQTEMDKFKFAEENAKSGKDWLIAIHSQNEALKTRNELLDKLNDAQKDQQQSLVDNMGATRSAVTFVNGRMVPVMSEYLKLTDKQKEAVDLAAENYNQYSDAIADNTQEMEGNTAEIEANLQKIEDKTVEMYDLIADAIRAAEEEKLKILNDGLDEERKLLDKRRQMYEDAFSEEDYTNSLNEITEERQKLIRQIAALEGATDLASLTKRQELLEQKKELDKQYNDTTRDFNREALLNTLDDEEQVIDDRQAAYEKEYEDRINSVEWLESEIQRIMNGGLTATIQFLKDNLPEYETAWTMSKDNLVEAWTDLYGVVNTTVQEIEDDIPDFTNMINQLQQAVGLIGQINSGSGGGGSGTNTGGTNTGGTTTKKTVWMYNGKEYPSETLANQAKGFDSRSAGAEVTRLTTALKNAKSISQAMAISSQLDQAKAINADVNKRKITSKIVSAKTGGLVDYNGLAMLHGTPSKPERVLSAVQTELFDNMVRSLEALSSNSSSSSNFNESIVIESITIQTPQLNSNMDFTAAGKTLAVELRKAMADRGLNLNKKK